MLYIHATFQSNWPKIGIMEGAKCAGVQIHPTILFYTCGSKNVLGFEAQAYININIQETFSTLSFMKGYENIIYLGGLQLTYLFHSKLSLLGASLEIRNSPSLFIVYECLYV